MRRYFWLNGEIVKIKYFQYFDRSKTRHDRAKIGLAGQHDRPPLKSYFEPWLVISWSSKLFLTCKSYRKICSVIFNAPAAVFLLTESANRRSRRIADQVLINHWYLLLFSLIFSKELNYLPRGNFAWHRIRFSQAAANINTTRPEPCQFPIHHVLNMHELITRYSNKLPQQNGPYEKSLPTRYLCP